MSAILKFISMKKKIYIKMSLKSEEKPQTGKNIHDIDIDI